MIERIVIGMVITFILRQLEKFKRQIDWEKLKADASERVRAILPGTWLDDEGSAAVVGVIQMAQCALAQKDAFDEILHLVAAQQWTEAAARLKQLLLDVWNQDSCPVNSPKVKELVDAA